MKDEFSKISFKRVWNAGWSDPEFGADYFRYTVLSGRDALRAYIKFAFVGVTVLILGQMLFVKDMLPAVMVIELFGIGITGMFTLLSHIYGPRLSANGLVLLTSSFYQSIIVIFIAVWSVARPERRVFVEYTLAIVIIACSNMNVSSRYMSLNLILSLAVIIPILAFNYQSDHSSMQYLRTSIFVFAGFVSFLNHSDRERMQMLRYRDNLKITSLLKRTLPVAVISKLMDRENLDDDLVASHDNVGILFADVVGFTTWSKQRSPEEVVSMLSKLFNTFDAVVATTKAQKIKTIGDSYMVAIGLPTPESQVEEKLCLLALQMMEKFKQFTASSQLSIQLRIGIHSGPVVAGIIGKDRYLYDLWGDAVNLAARLEAYGSPGSINVSEKIYEAMAADMVFSTVVPTELKGFGEVPVYRLIGPRNQNLKLTA